MCCCCLRRRSGRHTDLNTVDGLAKEQIMQELRVRNSEEYMIGVCGQGKIVDDTLKIVIRLAERDQLFQKIVTATVTKNPDLSRIQTQIGAAIGLNFDDEMDAGTSFCMCFGGGNKKILTSGERVDRLNGKLKELGSVLVVLYDINERLDLGKVGIPFGKDHNGCKILLTSSNEEVLSNQMNPHKLIHIMKSFGSY